MNFDVDLPEQYELLIAVARTRGTDSFNLGIHMGGGQVSEQFELNRGAVGPPWNEYTHSFHRQPGLDYKRDGYLTLDDLYLIDRRRRTTPWLYHLRRGKHGVGSPDDREWFAQHVITNANGQVFDCVLDAAQLPSDAVLNLLREAAPQPKQPPVGSSTLTIEGEQAKRN